MKPTNSSVLAAIRRLFNERGDSMYAGEPVTQSEHALQCASLAEQARSESSLIAAALLHDVGHLLHEFDEDCAVDGIDDEHQDRAAKWLARWFGPSVCEPIRLHVLAKRYRCAVEPSYFDQLSAASIRSLELQGGPLANDEFEQFQRHPYSDQALQLRQWDDEAKVPSLQTPSLDHFLSHVEESLR